MEFRKEGSVFVIMLKKGEKLMETLNRFVEEKQIKGGFFQAVGAVKGVEIGYYDHNKHEYDWKTMEGEHELLSLLGTVSETGVHAHIVVSDETYSCIGGHLKEAEISATLELFLTELKKIRRKQDAETGLKLMEL